MPNLYSRLTSPPARERGGTTLPVTFQQWIDYFKFDGSTYTVHSGAGEQNGEKAPENFRGYVEQLYKSNGIVYACMAARSLLFSEARFQFRRLRNGRPGDLFGTGELGILEQPWLNGTTGDLLAKAILDVDLAGNFYAVRRGAEIRRLRPDWVTIVLGSRTGSPIDTEVAGYEYQEGGTASGNEPVRLLPENVCHWVPPNQQDPTARFRGITWLTPILGDIMGDQAATTHKTSFLNKGANLGYVVTLDPEGKMNPDQFQLWVDKFKAGHEGLENAYKTLFLAHGADVKTVGTDLKQLDFKAIQGAGETRICAAARVPAIVAGVSEGLDASTYSNYGQAKRAFGDLTMRPLWRGISGALASIIDVPDDAELWYDDRDVPFLQEDLKDEAEIQQIEAATITMYVREGFTAESAIAAVQNHDNTMLEWTGLVSVQLQEPGAMSASDAQKNGTGPPVVPESTS